MKAFQTLLAKMDIYELQEFRNLIEMDIAAAMKKQSTEKYLHDYREKIRLVDTEIFNRTNTELFNQKN